jgi:hypothetical protein
MKVLKPSISNLLDRLSQLEERTARAEERAARAEAKASQLESATGHLAAAVVSPKAISRRSLLTKVAAAGAAGVAGALVLNKPKDVEAVFTWQGGATNVADAITNVVAGAAFPSARLLNLDTNQGTNTTQSIDGLQTFGANFFSGVAAYGGNKGGNAYYGVGGPAVASVANGGPAITGYGGTNLSGGQGYAAWLVGNGASDGTAGGYAVVSFGGGNGPAVYAQGGQGTTATPHVNGGPSIVAYGGPGATAAHILGDPFNVNNAIPAHGVRGSGNALGVGGYFAGGRAQIQIIPNGGVGAPTSGPHFAGDIYMDAAKVMWICTVNGTPGTFAPLQPGGINNAVFTAVSTQQYTLINSTGTTWVDMDATNLKLTITPTYNCQAWLSGSADLWTANAGFNQDIGISISGGVYPTAAGQPEGWKESGGFAGTFSPNAAHVETVVPLVAGTAYTIKLVWKTNKPGTSTIAAGAGPINSKFSPTRLSAWLIPTNPGGTIPRAPAQPYAAPAGLFTPPPVVDPYRKG